MASVAVAIDDERDPADEDAAEIVAVDPLFFACEECQGECRGHAFAEPLQAIVAGMEIGLTDRPEPTDEHDEVPLPLHGSDVEAFTDEFDNVVGWWGEWDPAKREWKIPWFSSGKGQAWIERIKRQRDERRIVLALLRVILIDRRAWRDCAGWRGSLNHEWIRDKIARLGVPASSLPNYLVLLRARGEIPAPTRNRAKRVRQR